MPSPFLQNDCLLKPVIEDSFLASNLISSSPLFETSVFSESSVFDTAKINDSKIFIGECRSFGAEKLF